MTFARTPALDPAGHEAEVAARFDLLRANFKSEVPENDPRLMGLVRHLEPLNGRLILDLGCGKGRFASRLADRGARVVGLDIAPGMLEGSHPLERIRASALRLPLADTSFDAVISVEVIEHLPPTALEAMLAGARRVLKPGGLMAIIDKNAGSWNAQRPWLPNLAVKWIDERRGRWMYPADGPVRERWFWPSRFRKTLAETFGDVQVEYLLSRDEESSLLFRHLPPARLYTLWTGRVPAGEPR